MESIPEFDRLMRSSCALDAARFHDQIEAMNRAAREKCERERKAEESVIELNARVKRQVEILEKQVKSLEDANDDATKRARESRIFNVIMLAIAIASIIVAILK